MRRGSWLRLLAVLLTLVMVMGTIPASAAKKTSSVEVSTKASLVKAIKKDGKASITLKTDKAVSIKIPSTQGSTTKKLVIDAPNASITNKTQFDTSGKTPAVTIKAVKYYTESVSGNTITLSGDGARINVSEKKTLKSLTVNGDNADICVRKKAKIENLTFKKKGVTAKLEATNKSKVNVTLSKKTSLTVLGEKSADVNVKSSAKGSTVKASIPVDLTATKNTNFAMNQGAEGSTVDKSGSKVKVTITNKSKSEPVVTINGEAQAIATPKPTATSKPTATATPTTTPTGSSAPVIEIYDGGSSGGYSGGGSSSGGGYSGGGSSSDSGYSGGYTPAPTNEVTPGPIVPTPDPVTPTEEVTPTEGVTTIPTEEVTTPTENPVTPTDAVTASPAEEVTPTEQITDEEFDSTVKIGEITFPIQSAWAEYMSPTDQGNGTYLGAYLTSYAQIYAYESIAVSEKNFNEVTSSKANFEYIGQLFVDELAKQAGATNPKVEIFDEGGTTYGKSIGTGSVQGVNMSFAIYFKLQDNNLILTMAMEMSTSISEESDAVAFKACKLAKGSENTTTPTETVTPTGTVDEDGNIIVTENDGAIVYKYSPEGVLLSKTIIDNGNKYEYYYDNSGKLVSERHTNFDGTVWNYEYEYDEQGNKSKYTQVNSDGSRYEHIYDISGKEIEFVQKWPNDDGGYRIRFKKTYEFNENNQVVKAIETSYDGNTPEIYITEYEYNNSGSQIKKSVTTPDGYTAILEYVFDEKGRTLKYILTDSDGDVHEYPFAYDEEDKQVQYVRQPGSGRNSRGAFCFQVVVCEVGASGHTDTETSYIGGEFYWKEERKYDETGKMIWKRITESDGSVTEYVLNEEDVFVIDSGIDIEEVEINEETFPDAIFREFIKANYDKNGDGSLSKSEIEVITEISCTPSDYLDMADLGIRREDFENDSQYEDAMHQAVREYWESGNGIKDLKGIEYFKNLRSLDCSWNQIERLVLNENTLLKSLNCRINKLKSIVTYTFKYFLTALADPIIPTNAPIATINNDILITIAVG